MRGKHYLLAESERPLLGRSLLCNWSLPSLSWPLPQLISTGLNAVMTTVGAALRGRPFHHIDGCFRISASACKRLASAALFVAAALFSNDDATLLSFPTSFKCELSAL